MRAQSLVAGAMSAAITIHGLEGLVYPPSIVATHGVASPYCPVGPDEIEIMVTLYPLNPHTGTVKVGMSLTLTDEVMGRTDKQLLPILAQYAQSLVHTYLERNASAGIDTVPI